MDFTIIKNKKPWLIRVAFLLFIGCFLMILGNSLGNNQQKKEEKPAQQTAPTLDTLNIMEKEMALRLETALKQIAGVGNVSVTVFLASGPKYHFAVNSTTTQRTTEEKDKSGLNRITTENNSNDQIVLQKEGTSSSENPVLLNEEQPQVQGILVVAEGAASSYIKREVTAMIENLLNIPAYKVTVEPKGGGMYLGSGER